MMRVSWFRKSGGCRFRVFTCAVLCLAQVGSLGVRPVAGQDGGDDKRRLNAGRVADERNGGEAAPEERPEPIGDDDPAVAATVAEIRRIYATYQAHLEAGRIEQAVAVCRQMLAIAEARLPESHWVTGDLLNNLGELLRRLDASEEAVGLLLRALAIYETAHGKESVKTSDANENLGNAYQALRKLDLAERAYLRSLSIRLKVLGAEDVSTAQLRRNLSLLYSKQGRFEEAYVSLDEAARVYEKVLGRGHAEYQRTLRAEASIRGDEGIACWRSGQYGKARKLLERAVRSLEELHGTRETLESGQLYNFLGIVSYYEGRYREARVHYEFALRMHERFEGPEDPATAYVVKNLAYLMVKQNQYEEARALFERNYQMCLKAFGQEHPRVADALLARSIAYLGEEQAVADLEKVLEIYHKLYGETHAEIARAYNNLAGAYMDLEQWEKAEEFGERALVLYRKVYDADFPGLGYPLSMMATIAQEGGDYAKARKYLDETIALREAAGESPGLISDHYDKRARCWWDEGERELAIRDLKTAIELAREQRTQFAGGDEERAAAFTDFISSYETMVEWQLAIGGTEGTATALLYAEQARARSLLDQIQLAGVDLLAGLEEAERAALERREAAATAAVVALEEKVALSVADADDARGGEIDALREELRVARGELASAYAAVRNASPAYQDLTSGDDGLTADAGEFVETLQREVAGADGVALQYVIGSEGSFVFVIPPVGEELRAVALELDEDAAETLGVEAGPVTAFSVATALYRDGGVWSRMTDREGDASDGLAALWDVLVPEDVRKGLLDGRYESLVVVPDMALAHLPFEALVVGASGGEPEYLLDAGPPIVYAPSASVLLHLMRDERKSEVTDRRPVLTVGDPRHLAVAEAAPAGTETTRMAYREMAARLAPLPHSRVESQWVVEVFQKNGIDVGTLVGERATEAVVRVSVPGRKIVHLACHGVAEEEFGNTFGALVLSPARGRNVATEDDGFLSLVEIYELDLRGCELAILSACQTNNGPDQVGEGVWSLSRGFLVAGARRVVASNWLVDDAAGASLVSVMSSAFAREEAAGGAVDYARALQRAKRWVRKQGEWKSPYYWAGMVQLGPGR